MQAGKSTTGFLYAKSQTDLIHTQVSASRQVRGQWLSGTFRMLVDAGMPDAIGKMKQFACWFTHGVRNGCELRQQVHSARTPAEVLHRVDAFFAGSVAV